MVAAKGESMRLTVSELKGFLDRDAYAAYELLDQFHRATAQTARTLQFTEGTGVQSLQS